MRESETTSAGAPLLGSPGASLDRALTRVSDAPLRHGNRLALLKNGPQAYDEWLDEIERAERWVHLENYLFKANGVGRRFAEALKAKAQEGVPVRVLYDWWGSMATPWSLWSELSAAGVEVRVFNPFALRAPLEAVLRDHRKVLTAMTSGANGSGPGSARSARSASIRPSARSARWMWSMQRGPWVRRCLFEVRHVSLCVDSERRKLTEPSGPEADGTVTRTTQPAVGGRENARRTDENVQPDIEREATYESQPDPAGEVRGE